jgi:hypothetical protein
MVVVWYGLLATFAATAIGAVCSWLWYRADGGNEPYYAMVSASAAAVLSGIGIVVQHLFGGKADDGSKPPQDTVPSLLTWLLANVAAKDLSETLPVALRLAQKTGDKDFEKWIRFEFNGYNQSEMSEGDSVPEYRNVPGRYVDQYKHMAPYFEDIPSLLKYRLPLSIRELEQHAKSQTEISIHDPDVLAMVRNRLRFPAERFICYPASVMAILDAVRSRMIDWLHRIQTSQSA